MALARLFERGVTALERGESIETISGATSADLLDTLNVCREDLFLVEALHLLTRHVTFVLTVESAVLEGEWLGLADRHLQIRSEIVDRRREEEQLKRVLKSLGGVTVPLPEHDDLPISDGDRPRKSRGMYDHLFAGATAVEIELALSEPTLIAADRVADARGWAQEWDEHARLLVLTHGISLALRGREADAIDGDDEASVRTALEVARSRLVHLEGRYSTMRRRLFELRHNNRILRWRITALEVEAIGMRSRLDQFLADRERLEHEIAERRAAGATPQPQPQRDGDQAAGWRRRIGRLFGRRT
jgi:hypothetical protein